ncbi:response regulator transcription factor [Anthocerotibacter panamensis]|uniref:response regulator transcription factor n=1 Tax=Anthocerotibacter panamensis TaxID=2857077 RepID=UPI001FD9F6BE|nr:LuxR C-terminal-related transcriptional regulator [Anthocerotibacter panamensis]
MSTPPIFWVVEDHPEMAKNNCDWLLKVDEQARCETICEPQKAQHRLSSAQPDLLVADLLYGQTNGEQSAQPGLDLLRFIFKNHPDLNILVYSSEPLLLSPLAEELSKHEGGFVAVNKMERRSLFVEGAKSALSGELKLPRELRSLIKLTERERTILHLICQESLTDQAVAERIYTSKKTVQNCVQRLKEKLGVPLEEETTNSRVSLCMEAIRRKMMTT